MQAYACTEEQKRNLKLPEIASYWPLLLRMGFFGVTWVCFPDVTSTLRTWECCNHGMSDSDYVRYFASSLFAISTTYQFREGELEGRGMRVQTLRNRRTRCSWIGSHLHDSIDFYGGAFSAIFNRVTRTGLHIFEISGVRKLWQVRIHLGGRFMVKKVVTIF